MFGSICPCGVEGFAWLDKQEIFVLSDSACIYEHAGQRVLTNRPLINLIQDIIRFSSICQADVLLYTVNEVVFECAFDYLM